MTPAERAEMIAQDYSRSCMPHRPISIDRLKTILTAQIEGAEREAINKCGTFHCESCHQDLESGDMLPDECSPGCCCDVLRSIEKAKKEGFSAAKEKAVRIIKMDITGSKTPEFVFHSNACHELIDRISEMKVEEK